jgi:multidrug efflux pump subunit AcrB
MAFAIMGGLLVGTILTLVFLPVLYVTWFGRSDVKTDKSKPVAAA